MKIVLGSTSEHKLRAVHEACRAMCFGNVEVTGLKTTSGVSEQPSGLKETLAGALNRAQDAWDNSEAALSIGIESGLILLNTHRGRAHMSDRYLDVAVIVVILPNGEKYVSTTTGIEFPSDVVGRAMECGFETTTAGSLISEELGRDGTDPHATLTQGRLTRSETLVQGIYAALAQIPASVIAGL